jgi:hypothetical protein
MSLKRWLDNGWLRRHQTSSKEFSNLMEIVDRDLKDAKTSISDDWRFGIAYNAALKLCTIFIIRRRLQSGKKPSVHLIRRKTIFLAAGIANCIFYN